MKAFLMHSDRDFDLQQALPANAQGLAQDLELDTLLHAMAGEDGVLLDVSRKAILQSQHEDVPAILYRQDIVKDCVANPAVVRRLYDIAVQAIEDKRRHRLGIFGNYPAGVLSGSIELLGLFASSLRALRRIAEGCAGRFSSVGFVNLFAMLEREFDDAYLGRIHEHLAELKFRRGVLVSAELGPGNGGKHYVLRKPRGQRGKWIERLFARGPRTYSFRIAERDDAGARALSELNDRGIHLVANALAQSSDHVLAFFEMLRTELAFHVACLNLHDVLSRKGEPIVFPVPRRTGERRLSFRGLYDVSLSLSMTPRVVGNAVSADDKSLIVITGANQGGKSSFLRSIGLAQLMMQTGMFVGAELFAAELACGIFTHYKREEDATMKSGKFDEELARMSGIVDQLRPDSLVLFNESFAATNEREGSEIARQIVRALLEKRVKVAFVTHLYDFASSLHDRHLPAALFLRAERHADGTRSFRLVEGEPLATSFGEDLYKKVFAVEAAEPSTV